MLNGLVIFRLDFRFFEWRSVFLLFERPHSTGCVFAPNAVHRSIEYEIARKLASFEAFPGGG
jgi:hypothetical protein